ncbi:MAG: M13 family peptidase, partial [Massilia sp.]
MKPFLLSTLTLSLVSAFACAAEPSVPTSPISGVAKEYIDTNVRVQDDFFTYLNGEWLKTTQIPADKASWGTFAKMRDDLNPQLRGIIEKTRTAKNPAGSEAQKIGDLYGSYMDEARLNELGYKPLSGELQRIRMVKDKKALPALMAHLTQIGVTTPYGLYVGQDARKSTVYAVSLSQSGLGLPDRDYYLKKDDAKMADALGKYEQFVADMLGKVGEKDAAAKAKAIVAFETSLAQAQWTKVENRDPVKRYNKVNLGELGALTPGFDWKAAMASAGVAGKVDYVIVNQPSYLTAMDQVIAQTELATLKEYLTWQLVRAYAPYMSKVFYDANFAFYGTVISGTKENQPRWKNGVGTVENVLGEAVGHIYVTQYFPAERKARMEQLVANVLAAYKQS